MVVESRGDSPARLRSGVTIERRIDGSWEPAGARGMALRASCAQEAPDCVELVGGAELRPPPWNKRREPTQCGAEGDSSPPGEYRFVVESCAPEGHEPHRVASDPFFVER